MKIKFFAFIFISACGALATGCYEDESVESPVKTHTPSGDPLDQHIQENFVEEFGIAVRYKFVDRYVDQNKRVTPPKLEVVQPMLEFLTEYWIAPFVEVPSGARFFRSHVPAEIVLIGSSIYNDDGTVTLGTADAGARITLTEVNKIDMADKEWILLQLRVIYHEFAHIVHQRYGLPSNFQDISPEGYTSLGSWYNLTEAQALERGFVSPYGTATVNEDFSEVVSSLLFDADFYEKYIIDEVGCGTADCVARNEGRAMLRRKYNAILEHYQQNTGVDLLKVRAIIQAKLQ